MESEDNLKLKIQQQSNEAQANLSRLQQDFLESKKLISQLQNENRLLKIQLENRARQIKSDLLINETKVKNYKNETSLLEQKIDVFFNDFKLLRAKEGKKSKEMVILKTKLELESFIRNNASPEFVQLQQQYDAAQKQIKVLKKKKDHIKIKAIRANGNLEQLQYQIRKLNEENEFLYKSLQIQYTELEKVLKEQATNNCKFKDLQSINTTTFNNLPNDTEIENKTKLKELDLNNIPAFKTFEDHAKEFANKNNLSANEIKYKSLELQSKNTATLNMSHNATEMRKLLETTASRIFPIENESKLKELQSQNNSALKKYPDALKKLAETNDGKVISNKNESKRKSKRKIVANDNEHKSKELHSRKNISPKETNCSKIISIENESKLKELQSTNTIDASETGKVCETDSSKIISNGNESSSLKELQSVAAATLNSEEELVADNDKSKFNKPQSENSTTLTNSSESNEFEKTNSGEIAAHYNEHKSEELQSKNEILPNATEIIKIAKSTIVFNENETELKNLKSCSTTTETTFPGATEFREIAKDKSSKNVSNENKINSTDSSVVTTLEPCLEVTQVSKATVNNEIAAHDSGLQLKNIALSNTSQCTTNIRSKTLINNFITNTSFEIILSILTTRDLMEFMEINFLNAILVPYMQTNKEGILLGTITDLDKILVCDIKD